MIQHSKPWISDADLTAVSACLRSHMVAEGSAVADFEAVLAGRFRYPHAVATGSGCQALLLALRAVAVDARSEVIVPTYVCPEVLGVVEYLGATPILADVGPDYLLSFHETKRLTTSRTAAIVVPYLFGIDCDLTRFRSLGVPLIADWAQYLPLSSGQPCIADLSVLSFEGTKMITAGEGGAVLAQHSFGAEVAGMKRVGGSNSKLNLFPLSDLQATLVAAQLARIDLILERRKAIADRYFEELANLPSMVLPTSIRSRSVFFRFPLQVRAGPDLAGIMDRFAANGVAVRRPVETMLHHVRSGSRQFPVAQSLFESTISLPIYPALTDDEVDRVISVSKEVFN